MPSLKVLGWEARVGSGFGKQKKEQFQMSGEFRDEDVVSGGRPGQQVNVPTLC